MDRRAAFLASFTFHLVCVLVAIFLLYRDKPSQSSVAPSQFDRGSIVWLNEASPGGGGGGGGDRNPQPTRQSQAPGSEAKTLLVREKQSFSQPPKTELPPPVPVGLDIPAQSMAASTSAILVGAIEGPPARLSRGPGDGAGADGGKGNGQSGGNGNGLGDGEIAGTGDGPYRPGNGITAPIALYREIPRYTIEALRAHVQGSVLLQCVVQTNGTCTEVHILRSPQPSLGLEREAAIAAMHWRFEPAKQLGQPVPMQITMELAFAIH